MINLTELEKGLVCLVPKKEAITKDSTLLTCHEYSVCDCTVLKLIEALRVYEDTLKGVYKNLDAIKYELSASVYTLEDDEFETTFYVRDCAHEALAQVAKILGSE